MISPFICRNKKNPINSYHPPSSHLQLEHSYSPDGGGGERKKQWMKRRQGKEVSLTPFASFPLSHPDNMSSFRRKDDEVVGQ